MDVQKPIILYDEIRSELGDSDFVFYKENTVDYINHFNKEGSDKSSHVVTINQVKTKVEYEDFINFLEKNKEAIDDVVMIESYPSLFNRVVSRFKQETKYSVFQK